MKKKSSIKKTLDEENSQIQIECMEYHSSNQPEICLLSCETGVIK